MNILIAYASRTGSAARAARLLESELPGAVAVDLAKSSPDPSKFDAVILGSGIRFGRIERPLRSFLEKYWEILREMDKAIFVCNAIPEDEREILRSNFSLRFRNACILAESLGGEIDLAALSKKDRLLLKASRPQLVERIREGLLPAIDTKKAKTFAKNFLDAIDPPKLVYDSRTRRMVEVRKATV